MRKHRIWLVVIWLLLCAEFLYLANAHAHSPYTKEECSGIADDMIVVVSNMAKGTPLENAQEQAKKQLGAMMGDKDSYVKDLNDLKLIENLINVIYQYPQHDPRVIYKFAFEACDMAGHYKA